MRAWPGSGCSVFGPLVPLPYHSAAPEIGKKLAETMCAAAISGTQNKDSRAFCKHSRRRLTPSQFDYVFRDAEAVLRRFLMVSAIKIFFALYRKTGGMRGGEIFSSVTLNVALAVFSMLMAVVALGLLAFVLAKDTLAQRDVARSHPRDKLRRHESTVVDFRNPSTVPEHFLQLNTLMFQKKPKNNQMKQMDPIELPGLIKIGNNRASELDFASRSLPPLPLDEEKASDMLDISSNQVSPVVREKKQVSIDMGSTSPTSFVTDSGISEDDSDTSSTRSSATSDSGRTIGPEDGRTENVAEVWLVEDVTIEPLAEKIVVDSECQTASLHSPC
ncbi:unnamed protein product [Caenorhabditis auriculariae]|uniref:Uncharacterized protein n=1 Tax=Caenorhabditis auriculariae TaxID=2777116 RepID=A0A8S1GU79_9PELO|nr:unnamed protein product [Caenorhabditis auriculariae]